MEVLQNAFVKALTAHVEGLNLDEAQLQKFIEHIPETIPAIVADTADSILKTLKDEAPAMLRQRHSDIPKFEKRNQRRWKPAFNLLEMFMVIAYEVGAEFNNKFREEASLQSDDVFNVLTRLHARGCQIGFEILTLIKSGFADAAHARWRTLHENAVVAFVIAKHGQDIAERYSLHEVIESYKAMCEYQKNFSALHDEPLPEEEMEQGKKAYDELVKCFGNNYKDQYGWATKALNKAKVRFSDLEIESGLAHLRPYYRMASHNVHANIKGAKFKLGMAPRAESILLAGPSNYGFTDPAHGAAISLMQITTALLNTRPNFDRLVILKILDKLQAEIGDEFLRIQRELEGHNHPVMEKYEVVNS